jgi:hypothetical protein
MSPMIVTGVRAILSPVMSLLLAMPELYRLGGSAARSVNRGGDSDRECAEFEVAPVANRRPHQPLLVPSDDAHGRPDGVLSPYW